MRILIVLSADDHRAGGSIRVAQHLAKGLVQKKIDVKILFAYGEAGVLSKLNICETHYLGLGRSKQFLLWGRFKRFVKNHRPDIIHFVQCPLWCLLFSKVGQVQYFCHIHGGYFRSPMPLLQRAAWYWLNFRIDKFIAITYGARRAVLARRITHPDKVEVLPNCIDYSAMQVCYDKLEIRRRLGVPCQVRVLGSVGRVVRGRGYVDLIRTLEVLGEGWHGLIVGEGPDSDYLESFADSRSMQSRVHFVGSFDDVRFTYAAMDAYGFFARYDSFGLATAEAMAAGVPVFGLRGAGEYSEVEYPLLTDDNCILIDRPDPANQWRDESDSTIRLLAAKITQFFDTDYKNEMTLRAKSHVCKYFDIERNVSECLAIYRRHVP